LALCFPQKNHKSWKDEAVRHAKELEDTIRSLEGQLQARSAEKATADVVVAELRARMASLEEEGVQASGQGRAEMIVLENDIEVRVLDGGFILSSAQPLTSPFQHTAEGAADCGSDTGEG
jgi:hypothetical protein